MVLAGESARSVAFWKLESLTDEQVLERLSTVLGSGRRALAELIAHLGEVEERRLHLEAACSSMFDYCVNRLGLSEDEACRRIDVARLARRFPTMFELLAAGQISLSVAALLKPHLTSENADGLLRDVSCCSVRRAREVLVEHFPRPDVPSSIRKLPDRKGLDPTPGESTLPDPMFAQPMFAQPMFTTPTTSASMRAGPHAETVSAAAAPLSAPSGPDDSKASASSNTVASASASAVQPAPRCKPFVSPPTRSACIEPLAPSRYKVQFTADAELEAKLALARDLLRHAIPDGDLAAIIARAVDLLVERLMHQRFGARKRDSASTQATASPAGAREAPQHDPEDKIEHGARTDTGHDAEHAGAPVAIPAGISRATRRSVAARDGLQCSWINDAGERCPARAWLEYDHRQPRAKGGGCEPANIRLLCRNHNRLAAEHEFGRAVIDRTIASRHRATPKHGRPPDAGVRSDDETVQQRPRRRGSVDDAALHATE